MYSYLPIFLKDFVIVCHKSTRSVNVLKKDYKISVAKMLEHRMRGWLDNLIINQDIFEYDLKVDRVGQSKIVYTLSCRNEYWQHQPCEFSFETILLKPSEAKQTLLCSYENALIENINSKNNYAISGILEDVKNDIDFNKILVNGCNL